MHNKQIKLKAHNTDLLESVRSALLPHARIVSSLTKSYWFVFIFHIWKVPAKVDTIEADVVDPVTHFHSRFSCLVFAVSVDYDLS